MSRVLKAGTAAKANLLAGAIVAMATSKVNIRRLVRNGIASSLVSPNICAIQHLYLSGREDYVALT